MSARGAVVGKPIADLVHPSIELVALCKRALETGLTFGLARVGRAGRRPRDRARLPRRSARARAVLVARAPRHRARSQAFAAKPRCIAQQQLSRRIIRQLAHEVKNPLGGLRGAAQLLERQLPDPGAQSLHACDHRRSRSPRRARRRHSAVPVARPRAEEVNLHRITEHVAQLIEAEKAPGVELVRDYDPSLPPINVDRNQMIQALLNLARNALQSVGDHGRLIFRTRALSNFTLGWRATPARALGRNRGQRSRHPGRTQGHDFLSARDGPNHGHRPWAHDRAGPRAVATAV